jgi:hypothetical protein
MPALMWAITGVLWRHVWLKIRLRITEPMEGIPATIWHFLCLAHLTFRDSPDGGFWTRNTGLRPHIVPPALHPLNRRDQLVDRHFSVAHRRLGLLWPRRALHVREVRARTAHPRGE